MGKNIEEANNFSQRINKNNEKLNYSIELIDKILKKIDIDNIDENSLAYYTSMSYMELKSSIKDLVARNEKINELVLFKGNELDSFESETVSN